MSNHPVPDTPVPDTPVPDEKDWTWVLHTPCAECGFWASSVDPVGVGAMIRENTEQWLEVLRSADVRTRPAPAVWSPLEYACHVRDVHVLYLARLEMMLTEVDPHYPNWDQDETAITQRYHEADPAVVAEELLAASTALADRFDQVQGDEWDRTGVRSDGAEFTIASFATYLIHDPIHHLHDAGVGAE
ncbi:MAG: DinB family protein [Acidimicrobiales bacterium]